QLEMNDNNIRKDVLDNGLTILTESIEHLRSISLGVWLNKGSRDESPEDAGIYHFIEHMVFKGTEKRSTYEIARIMDSIGGFNDAFTSKENTCFYAKILDEHLPIIFDIFSDILLYPRFDREDLERERKVVHEEFKMVEDNPSDLVHEIFLENFWAAHPLGRPILGTLNSVNALTPETLRERFLESYIPPNILISAAGNISHEKLMEAVQSYFTFPGIKDAHVLENQPAPEPRPMTLLRSKKDLEQAHLCIGAMGHSSDHPDRYAAGVMNVILGGSMSSRLFQKIREEMALCYTVFSSMSSFNDAGYVSVYAGTSPEMTQTAAELIIKECKLLAKEAVSNDELENAKNHLKGSLILSLESSSNRMFSLARNEMIFGRQISTQEILDEISKVTVDDVLRVSQDLFLHSDYGIVVVGDMDELNIVI
ncbi:MAG TPA: pitrilysin family protein, partial [Acidobacteriota bacterium]